MFDLKAFRQENNLTQKDIARIFSCNQNFVSRIENGIRPIPKDKMDILSNIYGDISKYSRRTGAMLRDRETESAPAAKPAGQTPAENPDTVAGMIELQKGYQQMLAKSQEQIDRLISIIEDMRKS